MRELSHLLHELEPPPGGLQRLQRAMIAREPSTWRRRHYIRIAALSCAALAATWAIWRMPSLMATRQRSALLRDAIHQAMTPGQNDVRIHNGSALELPSGQANVRIYLVQTESP
ncbi:hypothetical protein [Dyella sp.]|jgi:ferric-dicitrate binding protein FerR (iron transport regulator)|uniref:hypothetical protein n=1 Tax=Dyella sp. TaxID=1869338 RepID=UPI002FD8B807